MEFKRRIEWPAVIALIVVVPIIMAVLTLVISLFMTEAGANRKDRNSVFTLSPGEQVEMVVKGIPSRREIVLWYSRAEGLKLAPGCERVGTSQVVACAQGTTLMIVDDGKGGPARIQAETGNLQTRVTPGFPSGN